MSIFRAQVYGTVGETGAPVPLPVDTVTKRGCAPVWSKKHFVRGIIMNITLALSKDVQLQVY